MKIGIDLGNVIIGGDGIDTFFTEKYLETPEVPGAFQSVKMLRKNHEVHFISKCGEEVELKSVDWLEEYGYVSMLSGRTHFVRKRGLKAPMALALELDIFIDDREDVLDWMRGLVPHLILFKSWEQVNKELAVILADDEEKKEEELG